MTINFTDLNQLLIGALAGALAMAPIAGSSLVETIP